MYKPQDHYFKKAKKEGYPARSVYKLQEIDEKFHIFKPGDLVLDLGCSPGSWLLYIEKVISSDGKVVGIDLKPITVPSSAIFLQKNIFELKAEQIQNILQKNNLPSKFDVIVSDLAPATSGVKDVDSERSLELIKKAFSFIPPLLKKEGSFVCKAFESNDVHFLAKKVSLLFRFFKMFRPRATRKRSRELYIILSGWQGLTLPTTPQPEKNN
ncbi:MAG: RlmE family RNA methyltransferase [Parcubacteria group bacterium]|nr:RlmE family RNA methyltransferase [Parcubacteria group bacterium]